MSQPFKDLKHLKIIFIDGVEGWNVTAHMTASMCRGQRTVCPSALSFYLGGPGVSNSASGQVAGTVSS